MSRTRSGSNLALHGNVVVVWLFEIRKGSAEGALWAPSEPYSDRQKAMPLAEPRLLLIE
jgi:hypothetical protein